MQIWLFRLIQGAAYRSFRESSSANHETHLRVKNLPYRITDFVEFVKQAIALYKGLGVVENAQTISTPHRSENGIAKAVTKGRWE